MTLLSKAGKCGFLMKKENVGENIKKYPHIYLWSSASARHVSRHCINVHLDCGLEIQIGCFIDDMPMFKCSTMT